MKYLAALCLVFSSHIVNATLIQAADDWRPYTAALLSADSQTIKGKLILEFNQQYLNVPGLESAAFETFGAGGVYQTYEVAGDSFGIFSPAVRDAKVMLGEGESIPLKRLLSVGFDAGKLSSLSAESGMGTPSFIVGSLAGSGQWLAVDTVFGSPTYGDFVDQGIVSSFQEMHQAGRDTPEQVPESLGLWIFLLVPFLAVSRRHVKS